MKQAQLIVAFAALWAASASAQLTVTSHSLGGDWFFESDVDSFDGFYSINGPQPLNVVEQTTVRAPVFFGEDVEATFYREFHSEEITNGFRFNGSLVSDEYFDPFYREGHIFDAAISFELSEPTELRFSGSMLHHPFVDPSLGSPVLLNGMVIEIIGDNAYLGASVSFEPEIQVDQTALFPAGSYSLLFTNYSTNVGVIDNGIITVNTAWDITVEVVPAPVSVLPLALTGLLASRRRR